MRWPRSSDSSRRSPRPGSSQRETSSARSGRCLQKPLQRAAVKSGSCSSNSGSSVSTANSGISPTIERTFSGIVAAVGQVQHVVVELILLVPQARCPSPPMLVIASAMCRKCSKNLVAMSS